MKPALLHYGKLLLTAVVLFFVVITVLFILLELAPGDPIDALIGDFPATPEYRHAVEATYGLDKPVLERYFIYVGNILQGDLGTSVSTSRPVGEMIMGRIGYTLAIALPAWIISTIGGLTLGSVAARTRSRVLDGGISGFAVGLFSVPSFWLGILLIMLFSVVLHWLPTGGKAPYGQDGIAIQYAVLPIVTMAATELAYKARIMRSSVIESLGQDFIDTARSKGLPRGAVLWQHAMPNALLPMVTVAGYSLGFSLAGSVVVEKVFSWPGMGLLLLDAVTKKDTQVVLGIVIVITITVIIVNVLTDLVYGIVDPRLRARITGKSGKTR